MPYDIADMNEADKPLREYLESIVFIDAHGRTVVLPVVGDSTPDPEGDRG